jgi:hypothetical protein
MSPAISKEELAKGRAALLAEEQATRKKWCALEGHKWDLPQPNPFNSDTMGCIIICSRCNVHATVTINIDEAKPEAKPATSVAPPAAAAK